MEKKHWKYLSIGLLLLAIPLLIISVIPINTDLIDASTYRNSFTPTSLEISEIAEEFAIHPTDGSIGISQNQPGWEDQIQDSYTGYIRIGMAFGLIVGQGAYNDRGTMVGVDVALARHGMPLWPCFIGIMHPSMGDPVDLDNFKVLGHVLPTDLPEPNRFYWFSLGPFLSNIQAGESFLIVCLAVDLPPSPDNYWMWAGSDQNPYPRGRCAHWPGTGEWEYLDPNIDMCFITYTEPDAPPPPPEQPQITITSTYNVAAQAMGTLTLMGAVISGTKYFSLVV